MKAFELLKKLIRAANSSILALKVLLYIFPFKSKKNNIFRKVLSMQEVRYNHIDVIITYIGQLKLGVKK